MLCQQTAAEAAHRSEGNQEQETPVPPPIEDVAGKDHQQVLPPTAAKNEPIEQENYRQENQELEGIKEHPPVAVFLGSLTTLAVEDGKEDANCQGGGHHDDVPQLGRRCLNRSIHQWLRLCNGVRSRFSKGV